MCGIAGFLGSYPPDVLEGMNRLQEHRGPDDAGVWHDPIHGVGLAHRRLSIIDLSPAGQQPMWDAARRAIICFNGEIYNYRELRAELENDGFRFKSTTDTEVILNLYLRDGSACPERLDGIFSFALWDTQRKQLMLARDGFGVKPLYYASTTRGVVFASEIKALMQVEDLDLELDAEALLYYVSYMYAPCPHTPLRAVRKLPPGHAAWVGPRGLERMWEFYRLPYDQPLCDITTEEAEEQLRDHLSQAVHRQMVADVPVGAFLSGGLDSSAIVAFAQRCTANKQLDCFTIGIGDANREGFAEDLPYARSVAKHLGVRLHVVQAGRDMAARFEDMIYFLDEPQADPASLAVLFISELARENGIKVLLSGGGGDDIFSGYRRHFALMQEAYWSWLPETGRRALRAIAQHAPPSTAWGRRLSKAFRYADQSPQQRLASYFLWLHPAWLRRLAGERLREAARSVDPLKPMLGVLADMPPGTPPLHQMLALDSSFFLTDHNLNYTDRMSMATGVEVRVPFLDPALVKFATRLPPQLKQRGATGKWIFKRAMESILPHDVIYRPKTGFGVPLRHWMKHELRDYVHDCLAPDVLRDRGLFDATAVQQLVDLDASGRIDAAYPIFSLVCIEMWCRMFLDGRRAAISNGLNGTGHQQVTSV